MIVRMNTDVPIQLDGDTAAVLLDWLERESAVDSFKWAAARAGDRVALKRVLDATREAGAAGVDAEGARQRLEATLPPARPPGVTSAELRNAPEHIRRHLRFPAPDLIVDRVAYRLD